jgi:hypothetical protein
MPFQQQTIAVRIEAFNAFNWVQFGFPVTDINNSQFGVISGAATGYSPRVIQLTFRYRY